MQAGEEDGWSRQEEDSQLVKKRRCEEEGDPHSNLSDSQGEGKGSGEEWCLETDRRRDRVGRGRCIKSVKK